MKIKSSFVLLLICLMLAPAIALAGISVRIQPVEGGNEVRFGKVGAYTPYTSKAVSISITSDVKQQYQLVQTMTRPLTNSQGVALAERSLSAYAIRDGNVPGTLNAEHEFSVTTDRVVIYTSDQSGTSASFTLVYVLKNSDIILPGSYQGTLVFTVESLASAQSATRSVLPITADIESPGKLINITTASGAKSILLNSNKAETSSFDLIFEIQESLKEQYEISQYVTSLPESLEGKQLAAESLIVKSQGFKNGSGTAGDIPLANGEQTLYVSGPRGEADRFVVKYSLTDTEKQKAGNYKTAIQYYLKTRSGKKLLGTFPVAISIGRIFDLIVTTGEGSGIRFNNVPLDKRPQHSEILIEIQSNVGRQYQVSQQLPVKLMNSEGASIPPNYFTLRLEGINTKGTLRFTRPTEVKTGEMVLFLSDQTGSADKFKIIYEFTADTNVPAGNYAGSIMYTISEL
ncbi:MAG: hypothetical protein PHD29_05985 [bacterium]|nr:hypothetical protein [bacterium]MDD5354481.1 hypothetical protein [bacterium]MDD5756921.1 hypothetical protein [bacterium]